VLGRRKKKEGVGRFGQKPNALLEKCGAETINRVSGLLF
jgi:hypothetical protein